MLMKRIMSALVCLALVMPMDVMAGGRSGGGSSGDSRSSSSGFSGSRSSGSGFSSGSSRSSSSGFSSKPSAPSTPRSSSSGFSSTPKPSTPAPAASPSSTSRSTPSGFSSKPTSTTTAPVTKPSMSSVDSKVAKQNVVSGSGYKSKDQAVAAFKEKHASTYTNKFTSEPKSRPEYIPQSTSVGGKTVNITYNSGYGGYGYMHPLTGAWMAYDVMSDMAMMSMMMNRHGYTYVDGPGYAQPVVVGGGYYSNTGTGILTFFIVIVLFVAGLVLIMKLCE